MNTMPKGQERLPLTFVLLNTLAGASHGITTQELAKLTGLSVRSISRGLNALRFLGCISEERAGFGSTIKVALSLKGDIAASHVRSLITLFGTREAH